jgi:hypothetical protein
VGESYFGSIYTRGIDREAVRRALPEIRKKHSCCFLLAPEIDGWIGIYPSDHGQDDKVSAEIAGSLRTEVLHVILHADELFRYTYHFKGRLADEFSSKPEYFEEVTEKRRKALAGKPEKLRGLLRKPGDLHRLRQLLSSPRARRPLYAFWLLDRFAALFGLPNCATSYEYMWPEDADLDIVRRMEFEHVPDLAPEKARRAAAKAAFVSQMDALRGKGLVLFEQSPTDLSVFAADPTGQGFLVFGDRFVGFGSQADPFAAFMAARHRTCVFQRLAQPWEQASSSTVIETNPCVDAVRWARVSPSGRYLSVGLARETELWDIAAKRRLFGISHPDIVTNAGFTKDETAMITLTRKMDWNSIPDGKLVRSFPVTADQGVCALHPSGSVLVALEDPFTLAIIELPAGKVRKRFVLDSPDDLDLLPPWLAAGLREGDPRMITPGEANVYTMDAPRGLLFDSEGRRLFCATAKGAWVFDWESLLDSPNGHAEPRYRFRMATAPGPFNFLPILQMSTGVIDLTCDPETNCLLLASSDGRVRQMDLATGSTTTLLTIPDAGPICRIILSADRAALSTQEIGAMNDLQNQMQELFRMQALSGDPSAAAVPNERRPGRLLVWDYRKLLAGMGN